MDSRKEEHMDVGAFLLSHVVYLTFLFGTLMTLIGLKRLNVQNEKNSEIEKNTKTEKTNLAVLIYGGILVTAGCIILVCYAALGITI